MKQTSTKNDILIQLLRCRVAGSVPINLVDDVIDEIEHLRKKAYGSTETLTKEQQVAESRMAMDRIVALDEEMGLQ